MGKLISVAVTLAFLATSTGQLPKLIFKIQLAQLYLIKESQASKWAKARVSAQRFVTAETFENFAEVWKKYLVVAKDEVKKNIIHNS